MNALQIEFLIWRKVYTTTCYMYIYGHMREEVFTQRCKDMGFLDHEIDAELNAMRLRRDAIEKEVAGKANLENQS